MQQSVGFQTCPGKWHSNYYSVNLLSDIIQSNEVGGSYHMEKEGLHRVIEFLTGEGLQVGVLVTDCHKQINKWIRETHPEVKHYYDIWHVAKGL